MSILHRRPKLTDNIGGVDYPDAGAPCTMINASRTSDIMSAREATNLADNLSLEVFVRLRAELEYFCSIPKARLRRDRHPEVIEALRNWFAIGRLDRQMLIDAYLRGRSKRRKAARGGLEGDQKNVLLSQLERHSWPLTRRFFTEQDLKSIEMLKSAYRHAAKQCHPDVGGSKEAMVSLNGTYSTLLEALVRGTYFQGRNFGDNIAANAGEASAIVQQVESGYHRDPFGQQGLGQNKEFDNPVIRDELVAKLFLEVLVDDWNLDGATAVLLSQDGVPTLLSGRGPALIHHAQLLLDVVGMLIDRCYAIQRPDICVAAPPMLLNALWQARSDEYDAAHLQKIRRRLKTAISGKKRRVILSHPRQKENVARLTNCDLGAKTEVRSTESPARSEGNSVESSSKAIAITTSVVGAFTPLPFDQPDAPPPADPSRIPFVRVDGLPAESYSRSQSWEYHEAFYRHGGVRLQEKHRWARLSSTLFSLVLADIDPVPVVAQLALVARFNPTEMRHLEKVVMWHFEKVASFLMTLGRDALVERVSLLRKLHFLIRDSWQQRGVYLSNYDVNKYQLNVDCSVMYTRTLCAEIERLRRAAETGSLFTLEEREKIATKEIERINFWREVSEPIHFKIYDAAKNRDDETVVRLSEELIAKCQALGSEGLEYGFWCPPNGYEALTVSLVRLRRWAEALRRLNELFAMPQEWQEECASSRVQVLRQRLSRCEAMCVTLEQGKLSR